jgi:hypothetical protein
MTEPLSPPDSPVFPPPFAPLNAYSVGDPRRDFVLQWVTARLSCPTCEHDGAEVGRHVEGVNAFDAL